MSLKAASLLSVLALTHGVAAAPAPSSSPTSTGAATYPATAAYPINLFFSPSEGVFSLSNALANTSAGDAIALKAATDAVEESWTWNFGSDGSGQAPINIWGSDWCLFLNANNQVVIDHYTSHESDPHYKWSLTSSNQLQSATGSVCLGPGDNNLTAVSCDNAPVVFSSLLPPAYTAGQGPN